MLIPVYRFLKISIVLGSLMFGFANVTLAHDWKTKSYAHYADEEPIKELLERFAASIGNPIIVSEQISGKVSGKFEETNAKDFLDNLSTVYNLVWYHDGLVLYVYHSNEITTSMVDIGELSSMRLINVLSSLGILDGRYSLKIIDDEGIALISGAPRYVELVTETVKMIAKGAAKKSSKDEFVVRVFELEYAWADDREFRFNGQQVKAPGVASTLQAIMGRKTAADTVSQNNALETSSRLQPLQSVKDRIKQNRQYEQEEQIVSTGEAYIVANERLNAVIVHDRMSRMALYDDLITKLDVPVEQVEIEVSIIDVSTDRLEDMGVEWQVQGSGGSFATSDFTNGSLPRSTNELSLLLGNDVNFSTILSSTQDFFLTRIRMLSEEGDARVLSQPSILTLDNNEAVLDHSTTFFVRLTGDREVDLFPVSVGSVLRVTPHIIQESAERKVRLDISIEDGQQTGATVDDIPAISKSVINTQALIEDSGSLLIGGYYYNQDSQSNSKVPVLGDIPVVGRLFSSESTQTQKTARLFLITPRVVSLEDGEKAAKKAKELIGSSQFSIEEKLNVSSITPAMSDLEERWAEEELCY